MPLFVSLVRLAGFLGLIAVAWLLAEPAFRLPIRALAPLSRSRGQRRGQANLLRWIAPLICAALAGGGCDRVKNARGGIANAKGNAGEAQEDAKALSAQIDQGRDQLARLQVQFARDGAGLAAQFKALDERRKKLPVAGAAAIEAFNRDAAAYQARNARVRDEKAKIDACDQALSGLLSARAKLSPRALSAAEPSAPTEQATSTPASFKPARSEPAEVVIYSASWCGYCKLAKKHFDEKGVAYDDIDIEKSAEGAAKYRALGGGGIPIIVIKGHVIHGYDQARIDALL